MPANVKKVNEQVLRNIVLNTLNNKLENKKKLGEQLINVILSDKDSDEAKLKKAKYLLRLGADVHQKDEYGSTALIWAAFHGKMDVVKVLLAHGADVNAQETDGWTALMWAAYYKRKDIVQMLLENGADANIRNNSGSRVWESKDGEIVKVIKEHIKKTGGEPTNGGFWGEIFGGLTR